MQKALGNTQLKINQTFLINKGISCQCQRNLSRLVELRVRTLQLALGQDKIMPFLRGKMRYVYERNSSFYAGSCVFGIRISGVSCESLAVLVVRTHSLLLSHPPVLVMLYSVWVDGRYNLLDWDQLLERKYQKSTV